VKTDELKHSLAVVGNFIATGDTAGSSIPNTYVLYKTFLGTSLTYILIRENLTYKIYENLRNLPMYFSIFIEIKNFKKKVEKVEKLMKSTKKLKI